MFSKIGANVQVHEVVVVCAKGLLYAAVVHLLVLLQVGLAGEAPVADRAGEWFLACVDAAVADELRGHAEGLAALLTLVTLGLRVDAPVVFKRHEVGELLVALGAGEAARLVAVLVVEERAGVAVDAAAVLADVDLARVGFGRRRRPGRRLVLARAPVSAVRLHVALQVGQQAESLATFGAAVAGEPGVGVQGQGISKGLQAQGAVVEVLGVGFLVGEERAGMTV